MIGLSGIMSGIMSGMWGVLTGMPGSLGLPSLDIRTEDLWVVATAACCNAACGLLGCFLVLRRLALLGDAISHAILPGIAAAFLLSGTRDPLIMMAGAAVAGLATAALVALLGRFGGVHEDSAMGVVFTSLFALGVILISFAARRVDLDPGCVLYGLLEFVPFDTIEIGGRAIPRAFVWLAVVLAVDAALIALFFKELRIVAFDPALATTMGISAALVHYGFLAAVTGTAVAAFEAVGSILVVAMLVAPAAAAHLLTDRLSHMLWLSALLGVLSAVVGYALALRFDTSVAGMMSVTAGGFFVLAALFGPRHGLVPRQARRAWLGLRIRGEDLLAELWRRGERAGAPATTTPEGLLRAAPGWRGRLALLILRLRNEVAGRDDVRLTRRGAARASSLVRSHRLWEEWLARNLGLPEDRVHGPSHRMEHFIDPVLQRQLGRETPARVDPHGRPIPPPPPPERR